MDTRWDKNVKEKNDAEQLYMFSGNGHFKCWVREDAEKRRWSKKNNMKKVKHKIFWRDNIIILPFKNYLIQQTLKLYEIRWDVKYIMDRCCLQCIVLSTPFFVTFSLVTKLTHLGFFNEILKWKLIPVPSSTVPILNQSNLVHHTLFSVISLLIIPLTGLGCIR